jgi:hypothetical protein
VCTLLYVQHTALRAQSAPGFPCALFKERANELAKLERKTRCENESAVPQPSLRAKRSNPALPPQRKLDCVASLLAMTLSTRHARASTTYFLAKAKDVDGRDKPGHDDGE